MNYLIKITLFLFSLLLGMAIALAEETAPKITVGDIIEIRLPGETSFEKPFQVNREGVVSLPEVGEIELSGLTLQKAKLTILEKLEPVFKDLSRLEINLIERRLAVMVLGYVKTPGPVDLPHGATVQMAINSAGGLAQGAQLDKLQVRRDGNILTFDYKAYLDSGNPDLIPELQAMDTVFVPASPLTGNVQVEFDARTLTAAGDGGEDGQAVKVFGEVHRPGTFAYKGEPDVIDLIMRAGGVTRYAGIEQIRVISSGTPFPFNMREYLDTGNKALLPELVAGDTIFVPQASDQVKVGARTVYVMGEVFKPGAFETKEGASFYDILANAGGPTRFAETRQIRILRANGSVIPFDLQAYVDGPSAGALPEIVPGDAILVPEKVDMNEKSWLKVPPSRAIRIIGAVYRPGRYEWSDEMSMMDLIAHSGGPRAEADTAHVQVISQGETTPFDLKDFLEKGGSLSNLPRLSAGDTVVVPELPKDPNDNRSQWVRQSSERSIYIFGQVKAPGRYAFNENLNFLDILSAAQGPTQSADLRNVRVSHRKETGARVTKLNLHTYFQTGDEHLLPSVLPEDVIYVPERQAQWLSKPKEETVRVLGAIGRPGRYDYEDTMTILDLLAEAGGPTADALPDRIVVVNKRLQGDPHARTFDLVGFAKSGDFRDLPVLRAGDMVYIPHQDQSGWAIFSKAMRDAVSVLSLVTLIAGG
ncbi:SLBB domain-containing protein [Terasakiella sp. SH-1]|uniref:SLBB domain-containing protein n=1 Tax=Terasakiella sp. SH-1 TaxID=2560057 RepID=UPI001073DFF9|nr:SLBB domain-containing protein [Terasakiella sp. SH-1]